VNGQHEDVFALRPGMNPSIACVGGCVNLRAAHDF